MFVQQNQPNENEQHGDEKRNEMSEEHFFLNDKTSDKIKQRIGPKAKPGEIHVV